MAIRPLHAVSQRNGPSGDRVMPTEWPGDGFGPLEMSLHHAIICTVVVGMWECLKSGARCPQEHGKSLLMHQKMSSCMKSEQVAIALRLDNHSDGHQEPCEGITQDRTVQHHGLIPEVSLVRRRVVPCGTMKSLQHHVNEVMCARGCWVRCPCIKAHEHGSGFA